MLEEFAVSLTTKRVEHVLLEVRMRVCRLCVLRMRKVRNNLP